MGTLNVIDGNLADLTFMIKAVAKLKPILNKIAGILIVLTLSQELKLKDI